MTTSPSEDFAALQAFVEMFGQAARLQGIVERVLLLQAEIPALEQQQAALSASTALECEREAAARRDADDAHAAHMVLLETLKAERAVEQAGLTQDRQRRLQDAQTEEARLDAEHAERETARNQTIARLEGRIAELERRRANLAKGLEEAIAAASRK